MDEQSKIIYNLSVLEQWLDHNLTAYNQVQLDQSNVITNLQESLKACSSDCCIQSIIIPKIEEYMRRSVAPKFWSKFINANDYDEKHGFQNFKIAVDQLYIESSMLLPIFRKLDTNGPCKNVNCMHSKTTTVDYFKLLIKSSLLGQIPLYHSVIVEHFYKTAFNVFCNIEASSTADDSRNTFSEFCEGCGQEQNNCQCQTIVDIFHETNKKLIELGLLERLVGSILTSLIHIRIESHVSNICNKAFDRSQIEPLKNWLETVVVNWLTRIYSGGSSKSMSLDFKIQNAINTFKQKLCYFLYETYTRIRIDQLFNIVIDFPDSKPAIDDLRNCLERTDLRKHLMLSLRKALKTRLLHPGVSTPDILTAYIAAIKALRQLDPTGVLLETITEPIKVYLRGREDTVRCVVSGLLDESSTSELADELVKGEGIIKLNNDCSFQKNDKEDWESWSPDPVDADPSEVATTSKNLRRDSDIISMLVNIYGSQDLFVNEYRTLLADRLLTQLNYQTEREHRYLELLKRRFGDQQLHYCEVMIKDICDSKKINDRIHKDDNNYKSEAAIFSTSALILSAQFWPPFKEDWKLELPNLVQQQLKKYVKAFETLKGSRTLCWKSHLGNVNIDIETQDRKLNLNVSPIHATIILHFQDKSEWSLDQLSEVMHVPTTVLRRKIGYWVSQGLLLETSRGTFTLQEECSSSSPKNDNLNSAALDVIDDEELESVMASASDQREEELQVFWSYIVGMLTNLDSMPLERIHQMLKMFASQGSGAVECGLPELRHFLDKKVREHQLLYSGGLYKLPKQ